MALYHVSIRVYIHICVEQVNKLQLYSFFFALSLEEKGAFIVERNPRIVKDHTESRREGGWRVGVGVSASKMANNSHSPSVQGISTTAKA